MLNGLVRCAHTVIHLYESFHLVVKSKMTLLSSPIRAALHSLCSHKTERGERVRQTNIFNIALSVGKSIRNNILNHVSLFSCNYPFVFAYFILWNEQSNLNHFPSERNWVIVHSLIAMGNNFCFKSEWASSIYTCASPNSIELSWNWTIQYSLYSRACYYVTLRCLLS